MTTAWGIIVVVLGSLAWLGQLASAAHPTLAAKLGLAESESDVDPVYWADTRAEAVWDSLTLWCLPLAGVLLLIGNAWWVPLGFVGGGIYLYFGGRGFAQRWLMSRRGVRIGHPKMVGFFYGVLVAWSLAGAGTIALAGFAMASG